MTYSAFLARFLLIPIVLLSAAALWDARRGRRRPAVLRAWPAWAAVGLHVVVAVAYTTPWDNYLVATGVWWYDPALVTGLRLGWVPIEEYTFFVLQTVLAGLWLVFLARRLPGPPPAPAPGWLRVALPVVLAPVWVASVTALAAGWPRATYMALILGWALPPIGLQLAFGADILWRYRRLAGPALGLLVLYLALVDSVAIGGGTWTISPAQSFGLLLGGVLPVEELVFFLVTTTLIVFGVTLLWARDSLERFRLAMRRVRLAGGREGAR